MTKDEAVEKSLDQSELDFFGDKRGNLYKAIDEYAKQQAIAFDVWKRVNLYTLDYPNNRYIKLIIFPGDKATTEMVPVDKVYAQFIEQQNKDNETNKRG